MINRPFFTLIQREIWRFLGLYKQTLIPSIVSSGLYIVVFGESLGSRIGEIKQITSGAWFLTFIFVAKFIFL